MIGYFLRSTKIVKMIMIPKPGKPTKKIESYRPLGLLEVQTRGI